MLRSEQESLFYLSRQVFHACLLYYGKQSLLRSTKVLKRNWEICKLDDKGKMNLHTTKAIKKNIFQLCFNVSIHNTILALLIKVNELFPLFTCDWIKAIKIQKEQPKCSLKILQQYGKYINVLQCNGINYCITYLG